MLCTCQCGQGMVRVWHGIGKVRHGMQQLGSAIFLFLISKWCICSPCKNDVVRKDVVGYGTGLAPEYGTGACSILAQIEKYGTAPGLSCSAPGLFCPAPGLTVSPAVCCFEGFVVASGLGCPACSTPGPPGVWHGYGTGMVRVREKNVLCTCQCGQGMVRVWHGIAKVWHGI